MTLRALRLKGGEEGAVTEREGETGGEREGEGERDGEGGMERDREGRREQELCGEGSLTGAGTLGEGLLPVRGDMTGREPWNIYSHPSFFPLSDLLELLPIV